MKKKLIYHIIACAVVAFAITSIVGKTCDLILPSCLAGLLGGIACGAGEEYGDSHANGNNWSWSDIMYDAIGAVIGCVCGIITILI